MTALLVVLMFAVFVGLDLAVRRLGSWMSEREARRERAEVLAASVRLDCAAEAPSLTRVRVPGAKAAILAVDDEPVVLDSLRKILVLAGYSIDTVQSGPEALGLLQRNDYDVVLTDLKMPGMDGVEVVKSVKHLRPDVDVAVVTGYGTIETAVATLQHDAVDYVQKPFTEDELAAFVRRLLIRREARVAAARRPVVRVVAPSAADEARSSEHYVAGGAFFSAGHTWLRIDTSGRVRVGLDDLSRRVLAAADTIDLPSPGQQVTRGDLLFALRHGGDVARFTAPVGGTVAEVNRDLALHPGLVLESPYDLGWVCTLQASDLGGELSALRIGRPAVEWYQDEVQRVRQTLAASGADWGRYEREFLKDPSRDRSPVPV